MAKWGGEADAAAESAGGGGGNKFPPAPRGIYTVQVADFEDGQTKGNPEKGTPVRNKVDLTLEVSDQGDEFGKKVWLTITQIPKGAPGHGMMVHQLHAFGLALDGNYDFDTAELQGRTARVLLGVTQKEKVKDGKTYLNDVNFIEELYTEKHPEPADGVLPPPREPRKGEAKKPAPQPSAAAQKVFGSGAKTPAAAGAGRSKDVPF